jgi:hypothetical protein
MTKADLDTFRRDLERRILAGEYRPQCDDVLEPEQKS